jgi:hypothetical protein
MSTTKSSPLTKAVYQVEVKVEEVWKSNDSRPPLNSCATKTVHILAPSFDSAIDHTKKLVSELCPNTPTRTYNSTILNAQRLVADIYEATGPTLENKIALTKIMLSDLEAISRHQEEINRRPNKS